MVPLINWSRFNNNKMKTKNSYTGFMPSIDLDDIPDVTSAIVQDMIKEIDNDILSSLIEEQEYVNKRLKETKKKLERL